MPWAAWRRPPPASSVACFFGDASTASRRLAKLAALRLLEVHVPNQAGPNVYTLSRRGFELLVRGGADASVLHRSRVGMHLDLHLGALNDLRVEFVLATRERTDVRLEAFHADLDLRRAAGSAPPAYVPDAMVEITTPAGALVLVVEIDTGAEGASVFATKVATTVELWRSGAKCWGAVPGSWRPAVFVPSEPRARSLARVISGKGGGALWLVAELPRVLEVGPLGPVFATADEIAATPSSEPVRYAGRIAPAASEARP